jgi:molecular chaperone GrpE
VEETGLAEVDEPPKSELETLTLELEEARDLLRRKHAELENYRKRVEREQQDFLTYASSELVLQILPVVDNLERALESDAADSETQLGEGVEIIYRQFRDILKKAGLREVAPLGEEFDPHVHEAVAGVESTEHQDGEVVEVLQKGYFMKNRLLRPAMVKVARHPSSGSSVNEGDSSQSSESPENEEEVSSDA